MPRHIFRLVLLLVAFAAVGFAAITFLTVDSFFQYGHYRGDSVAEIASDKPRFQGTAYCQSCHEAQSALWSEGVHHRADTGTVVICETCHGAAGGGEAAGPSGASASGRLHPENLKLTVPADTRVLCTLCHEKLPARPAAQPQIVVAEHAGEQQCAVCHDPHSPLLNLVSSQPAAASGSAAAGEAKAADCIGCHGASGVSVVTTYPSLKGKSGDFIRKSLTDFRSGARKNPVMNAMAAGLSNADIENLGDYFDSLK